MRAHPAGPRKQPSHPPTTPSGTYKYFSFEVRNLFTDTAAVLNSIVSNSYYEMLRISEHPIIDIWNSRVQNGHLICEKDYYMTSCDVKMQPSCILTMTNNDSKKVTVETHKERYD